MTSNGLIAKYQLTSVMSPYWAIILKESSILTCIYQWVCGLLPSFVNGSRIQFVMCQLMQTAILNYLDDLAGADAPDLVLKAYEELGNVLLSCGLEESKEKACPPSTCMTFIGVLFNSEDLTLSVTPERVQVLLDLLQLWLQKQSDMSMSDDITF